MIEQAELTPVQQFEVMRAISRCVAMPSRLRIQGVNEFDYRDQQRLSLYCDKLIESGLAERVYDRMIVKGQEKEIFAGVRLSLTGVLAREELAERLAGITEKHE